MILGQGGPWLAHYMQSTTGRSSSPPRQGMDGLEGQPGATWLATGGRGRLNSEPAESLCQSWGTLGGEAEPSSDTWCLRSPSSQTACLGGWKVCSLQCGLAWSSAVARKVIVSGIRVARADPVKVTAKQQIEKNQCQKCNAAVPSDC